MSSDTNERETEGKTRDEDVEIEVPALVTDSGRHLPFSNNAVEKEQKKLSLAPTFDRLIAANLELTQAVTRLVRVSYIMIIVYAISLIAVVSARHG